MPLHKFKLHAKTNIDEETKKLALKYPFLSFNQLRNKAKALLKTRTMNQNTHERSATGVHVKPQTFSYREWSRNLSEKRNQEYTDCKVTRCKATSLFATVEDWMRNPPSCRKNDTNIIEEERNFLASQVDIFEFQDSECELQGVVSVSMKAYRKKRIPRIAHKTPSQTQCTTDKTRSSDFSKQQSNPPKVGKKRSVLFPTFCQHVTPPSANPKTAPLSKPDCKNKASKKQKVRRRIELDFVKSKKISASVPNRSPINLRPRRKMQKAETPTFDSEEDCIPSTPLPIRHTSAIESPGDSSNSTAPSEPSILETPTTTAEACILTSEPIIFTSDPRPLTEPFVCFSKPVTPTVEVAIRNSEPEIPISESPIPVPEPSIHTSDTAASTSKVAASTKRSSTPSMGAVTLALFSPSVHKLGVIVASSNATSPAPTKRAKCSSAALTFPISILSSTLRKTANDIPEKHNKATARVHFACDVGEGSQPSDDDACCFLVSRVLPPNCAENDCTTEEKPRDSKKASIVAKNSGFLKGKLYFCSADEAKVVNHFQQSTTQLANTAINVVSNATPLQEEIVFKQKAQKNATAQKKRNMQPKGKAAEHTDNSGSISETKRIMRNNSLDKTKDPETLIGTPKKSKKSSTIATRSTSAGNQEKNPPTDLGKIRHKEPETVSSTCVSPCKSLQSRTGTRDLHATDINNECDILMVNDTFELNETSQLIIAPSYEWEVSKETGILSENSRALSKLTVDACHKLPQAISPSKKSGTNKGKQGYVGCGPSAKAMINTQWKKQLKLSKSQQTCTHSLKKSLNKADTANELDSGTKADRQLLPRPRATDLKDPFQENGRSLECLSGRNENLPYAHKDKGSTEATSVKEIHESFLSVTMTKTSGQNLLSRKRKPRSELKSAKYPKNLNNNLHETNKEQEKAAACNGRLPCNNNDVANVEVQESSSSQCTPNTAFVKIYRQSLLENAKSMPCVTNKESGDVWPNRLTSEFNIHNGPNKQKKLPRTDPNICWGLSGDEAAESIDRNEYEKQMDATNTNQQKALMTPASGQPDNLTHKRKFNTLKKVCDDSIFDKLVVHNKKGLKPHMAGKKTAQQINTSVFQRLNVTRNKKVSFQDCEKDGVPGNSHDEQSINSRQQSPVIRSKTFDDSIGAEKILTTEILKKQINKEQHNSKLSETDTLERNKHGKKTDAPKMKQVQVLVSPIKFSHKRSLDTLKKICDDAVFDKLVLDNQKEHNLQVGCKNTSYQFNTPASRILDGPRNKTVSFQDTAKDGVSDYSQTEQSTNSGQKTPSVRSKTFYGTSNAEIMATTEISTKQMRKKLQTSQETETTKEIDNGTAKYLNLTTLDPQEFDPPCTPENSDAELCAASPEITSSLQFMAAQSKKSRTSSKFQESMTTIKANRKQCKIQLQTSEQPESPITSMNKGSTKDVNVTKKHGNFDLQQFDSPYSQHSSDSVDFLTSPAMSPEGTLSPKLNDVILTAYDCAQSNREQLDAIEEFTQKCSVLINQDLSMNENFLKIVGNSTAKDNRTDPNQEVVCATGENSEPTISRNETSVSGYQDELGLVSTKVATVTLMNQETDKQITTQNRSKYKPLDFVLHSSANKETLQPSTPKGTALLKTNFNSWLKYMFPSSHPKLVNSVIINPVRCQKRHLTQFEHDGDSNDVCYSEMDNDSDVFNGQKQKKHSKLISFSGEVSSKEPQFISGVNVNSATSVSNNAIKPNLMTNPITTRLTTQNTLFSASKNGVTNLKDDLHNEKFLTSPGPSSRVITMEISNVLKDILKNMTNYDKPTSFDKVVPSNGWCGDLDQLSGTCVECYDNSPPSEVVLQTENAYSLDKFDKIFSNHRHLTASDASSDEDEIPVWCSKMDIDNKGPQKKSLPDEIFQVKKATSKSKRNMEVVFQHNESVNWQHTGRMTHSGLNTWSSEESVGHFDTSPFHSNKIPQTPAYVLDFKTLFSCENTTTVLSPNNLTVKDPQTHKTEKYQNGQPFLRCKKYASESLGAQMMSHKQSYGKNPFEHHRLEFDASSKCKRVDFESKCASMQDVTGESSGVDTDVDLADNTLDTWTKKPILSNNNSPYNETGQLMRFVSRSDNHTQSRKSKWIETDFLKSTTTDNSFEFEDILHRIKNGVQPSHRDGRCETTSKDVISKNTLKEKKSGSKQQSCMAETDFDFQNILNRIRTGQSDQQNPANCNNECETAMHKKCETAPKEQALHTNETVEDIINKFFRNQNITDERNNPSANSNSVAYRRKKAESDDAVKKRFCYDKMLQSNKSKSGAISKVGMQKATVKAQDVQGVDGDCDKAANFHGNQPIVSCNLVDKTLEKDTAFLAYQEPQKPCLPTRAVAMKRKYETSQIHGQRRFFKTKPSAIGEVPESCNKTKTKPYEKSYRKTKPKQDSCYIYPSLTSGSSKRKDTPMQELNPPLSNYAPKEKNARFLKFYKGTYSRTHCTEIDDPTWMPRPKKSAKRKQAPKKPAANIQDNTQIVDDILLEIQNRQLTDNIRSSTVNSTQQTDTQISKCQESLSKIHRGRSLSRKVDAYNVFEMFDDIQPTPGSVMRRNRTLLSGNLSPSVSSVFTSSQSTWF